MKTTLKGLFSVSESETDYFNNKQDKIEVVSCPRDGMICQEQLSLINKSYIVSEHYFRDKDFQQSIDSLKEAFYETFELDESPCTKCALHFRSTITESLENMHGELKKMTSGFFARKEHRPSLDKVTDILVEFEKVNLNESSHTDVSKMRFIGNLDMQQNPARLVKRYAAIL